MVRKFLHGIKIGICKFLQSNKIRKTKYAETYIFFGKFMFLFFIILVFVRHEVAISFPV